MPDTQVKVSATGLRALARRFGAVDREVGKVGRTGNRVGRVLTRRFTGLSTRIGGLKTAVAGLGIAMKARDILSFGDKLGLLQAKAKLTNTEAMKLKDQLLALGPAYGINKEEAMGAAQAFQDYTGVLKEGAKDLELLAKLNKSTGASMKELAVIDALFIKQGFNFDARVKGFAALVAQADAGTVSLEAMAKIMPEILGLGQTYGFGGQRGVSQLGTALQVAGGVFGGRGEESRTSVKALLRDLNTNQKKIKGRLGVEVFAPGGGMRDLTKLMADISRATGGQMQGKKGLSQFFTADSQVLAGAWAQAIKKGDVRKIQRAGVGAGEADIEAAFKRRTEGIAKEFDKVQRGLGKLDNAVQKFGSTILGFALEDPSKTAMVAGGGYLALKILPAIARVLMARKGAGAGGGGGAAFGGVSPVFVVNMPGATPWQAAGLGIQPGGAPGAPAGKSRSRAGAAVGAGLHVGAGLMLVNEAGRMISGEAPAGGLSGMMNQIAQKGLAKQQATEANKAALRGTARGLARASAAGAQTFGAPGAKQELTKANVAQALLAKGAQMGLTGQELKDAVVRAITEAFAKNPIRIEAKGGLDAPTARRGAPQ